MAWSAEIFLDIIILDGENWKLYPPFSEKYQNSLTPFKEM